MADEQIPMPDAWMDGILRDATKAGEDRSIAAEARAGVIWRWALSTMNDPCEVSDVPKAWRLPDGAELHLLPEGAMDLISRRVDERRAMERRIEWLEGMIAIRDRRLEWQERRIEELLSREEKEWIQPDLLEQIR